MQDARDTETGGGFFGGRLCDEGAALRCLRFFGCFFAIHKCRQGNGYLKWTALF